MQFIRKNLKIVGGVIIIVVFAFIGTIFLVWGRGGKSQDELGVVAWVGKTPIYQAEREDLYRNLLQFYQNIYKNLSAAEIERRFDLRKSSLDNLINRRAVFLEAGKRGLTVADDEVKQKILSNAAFQTNGAFDRARYLQLIQAMNRTSEQFEKSQRDDILVNKMEAIIKEGVKVTDAETMESYRRANEKVSLAYVLISAESFKARVTVGEAELSEYFEKSRQAYFQPERVQVDYARIDPAALAAAVEPDAKAIEEFFEEHKAEMITPRTVRARHILFRLDTGAPDDEEKKIRDRASAVLERAKSGTDFAALAREFSQDGSGPRGGDLGYFAKEEMVPEFAEAAFSLPKGGVSDLVRTQFGFHIVKVEDIREAATQTLDEARPTIAARLKADMGKEKARDLAEKLNDAILDKPLDKAAGELGLEVKSSGMFSLDEDPPGLNLPKEVKETLFKLNRDEISEEIQWGGSRFVFRLMGRRDGHLPDLAEVREKVLADLKEKKAKELALAQAQDFRRLMDGGADPQKLAAGKYPAGVTTPFTRAGIVPEMGAPGEKLAEAFSAAVGAVGGPVDIGRGYADYRVVQKVQVDMADYEKEKGRISDGIWQEKSQRFFQAWVDEVKKRIGVKLPSEETTKL